jgi:DHA1 family tetracycline resistance protein-like MFS transporter
MSQNVKLAVLFGVLVINIFGIGLMMPVMPQLIRELTGGDIGNAAWIYGFLLAGYAAMQFLFGPLLGALSDRFGRRPILIWCMLGLGIDYIILALAPTLWLVFVARLIGGMMSASITTASAYVADITPPEKRAQSYGITGAAFGIGFIGGPVVGGILGEYGPRIPFFAAAVVSLCAVAFTYFLLPESLPKENRRPFRLREANPIGAFMLVGKYPAVVALLVVFALSQFAERMLESTWVLYADYRFGWGSAQIGLSFAWIGVLVVITQGFLVRIVVPRIGEWRTLVNGLAIAAVCMAAIAFISDGWLLYAVIVPYVLAWGLCGPAGQAIVTKAVPPNEQGSLQGAITAAGTLMGVIAPPLSGTLFGYFISDAAPIHLPGVAFLFGSMLFVIGLVLAIGPMRRDRALRRAAREQQTLA